MAERKGKTGDPLRIAYVLTSLGVGGAEKQTLALAERMAARGHKVMVVVMMAAGGEELETGLPVLRLNMVKTVKGIWKGARFAGQFLSAFVPNVVHSHTFPANMLARLMRLRGLRVPVVNTIHNVYEGGWHRRLLYRLSDGLAARVTAVSEAAAARYAGGSPVLVATNGVDVEAFRPERGRRKRVRREMGAGAGFVWLAVGRIAPAKDYANLLGAFRRVRKAHADAELWIAGEGEPVRMQDGVRWLGLRADVAELMEACDGFVMSSAWEGMPLALGEAMAMERPVVATDVGGVRELMGDCGWLVRAKDSSALAETMERVMGDGEREAMGKWARARVVERFSRESRVGVWEGVYGGVRGRGSGIME